MCSFSSTYFVRKDIWAFFLHHVNARMDRTSKIDNKDIAVPYKNSSNNPRNLF